MYKDFEMPLLKNKSGSKQMFMINEAFKYLPDDYDYYVDDTLINPFSK